MRYLTCLLAVKHNSGLGLNLPNVAIPRHARDEIFAVGIKRCKAPFDGVTLYTRHKVDSRKAVLSLAQLKASHGEEFWVRSIERYPQEEFVADYNRMKPKGLENTELESRDGLWVRVDEARLRLEMLGMEHFEGGVTLNVGFGDAGPVKVRKDLSGFSVRMRDHSLVYVAASDGKHILLMHRRPRESMHTTVLDAWSAGTDGNVVRMADFRNGIEFVNRPTSFEGRYEIRLSSALRTYVGARLFQGSPLGYKKRRGDLGEELINEILTRLDCPELMRYPLGRCGGLLGHGRPDSLRRTPDNLLAYFESKWWKKVKAAACDATKQVKSFLEEDKFGSETVAGAYMAILDWNPWEVECALTVSKVW
ncbi:MAG: hypothetical protein JRN59_02770 [Nitrososphaerota archaeon]|nr:hypothetical protein [Nitrososphaerota archaeon]